MADWKDVWRDAIDAAKGSVEKRVPEAAKYLRDVAEAHKKSLASLLAAFTDGKIDNATLKSELDDERTVFEGELLAVQAMTKKAAQDATNAFFDVIEKAVTAGIGGLL
jgi:hypothetical protein